MEVLAGSHGYSCLSPVVKVSLFLQSGPTFLSTEFHTWYENPRGAKAEPSFPLKFLKLRKGLMCYTSEFEVICYKQ
jgi:hypothetical protein